jgi:hypothetical protein
MVSKGLTGEAQTVIPGRCDSAEPGISRFSARRMGGAKRYPSTPPRVAMGIASLHPSYENTPPPSRGAFRPGFANRFAQREEGAGNAGCLLHPRSRVQEMVVEAHTSIQVQSEHSGIPCAMVLRLMPRSPRRRIPLASVIGELTASRTRSGELRLRRLDASHGRQDHTVLPYASASFVCRAADRSRAKARPAILSAQRALPRPPHSDPRP